VRPRVSVGAASKEDFGHKDVQSLLKHKCEHCSHPGFPRRQGLALHQTRFCGMARREVHAQEFEVEAVVDTRGPPQHRFYLVRWKGDWGDQQETWEPWRHLTHCGDQVDNFWVQSGLYKEAYIRAPGEHRCTFCAKNFASGERYLKSHLTKSSSKGGCDCKPRSLIGTAAEKAVFRNKQAIAQASAEKVVLEGQELKSTFCFKYLGFEFDADGDRRHALSVSMGKAGSRFGKMCKLWDNKQLPLRVRLRLFEAGVVSVLVYGSEAWMLTEETQASLRGWCARCVSKITGRTIRDECVDPTFDLVGRLRSRRLKWLGQLLRNKNEELLVRRVVAVQCEQALEAGCYRAGSLFMDAPKHNTVEELVAASHMPEWAKLVKALKPIGFNAVLQSEEGVLRYE
jgi:hypothetical protein